MPNVSSVGGDSVTLTLGIPDFKRQIDALKDDMQTKVVRAATRAAAVVFLAKARQFAPVLQDPHKGQFSGALKRALYVFRSKDSTSGREHYVVGVRTGKKRVKRLRGAGLEDAYYWRFVEKGHLYRAPGRALRGGDRFKAVQRKRLIATGAKFVAARPYLAPAFQAEKTDALNRFNDVLQKRIDKANADK